MIHRYSFGKPIDTEAVVMKIEPEMGAVPFLTVADDLSVFTCEMGDSDIVYGLGENVRGINKRGWIYESKCSDNPDHQEDTHSLYGAHNFMILDGEACFGVFVDTPGIVSFDVGYSRRTVLEISVKNKDFDLYILEGEEPHVIVRQFRQLIGTSYIPPKWAFGYGQSRWSYMDADEVREVVREHQKNQIPLDSIYLDIDYMERYKDFTINETAFPDFRGFVKEMREQGIHLVPIIDAGVKIEKGYTVYEEGVREGYFCKEENGDDFVAGVWPGRVHFPDMLNEKVRAWFGDKYQILLDEGIEGFWNDMNEPAIFYSEKYLKEVFQMLHAYEAKNLDVDSFFEFQDLVSGIANNEADYRCFYHDYKGKRIRHDKVHNLYGYYMTRAATEAFWRLKPDKRILMFSRSSYIGMHRYGGIWTGDNKSWWSHILMNIQMLPSLNMCGFLYVGADLGGFGSDTTEDLLLRWLELGIFTPLMRNHSARGTRRQEAYRFGNVKAFRNIIGIRYGLLPYLYSEYMKAALNGDMYFKPLSFVYRGDERARLIENQLMVGESIMIAPVYEQNAKGRYVYLPEEMKMLRLRSTSDMDVEILEKGEHYVSVQLDEVLIFIRPDCLVPMAGVSANTAIMDENHLRLIGFIKTEAAYKLYSDDGYTKVYDLEENVTKIKVNQGGEMVVRGNLQLDFAPNII